MNLALKLEPHSTEILTDLITVLGWVGSVITDKKRVQIKGVAKMLVKHHLGILELATEFDLKLSMVFAPSERNKAAVLVRVKKAWPVG